MKKIRHVHPNIEISGSRYGDGRYRERGHWESLLMLKKRLEERSVVILEVIKF